MSHDKHSGKHTSTSKLHEKLETEKKAAHKDADVEVENSEENLDYLSYDELKEKLKAAETKATESWDRALRTKAEMDNMQRRTEKDIESAHKYALEKFANDLLPVVDNLERGLENQDEPGNGIIEGVQLTLKMFYDVLKKFGVEQIDPTGHPFNPELHQAVSVQSDPKVQTNMVINTLQKGYLLNGRLVRPALVIVSK